MAKEPLIVVEMTKNGSEMTEGELTVFAEQMYPLMMSKIETSRSKDAAAQADEQHTGSRVRIGAVGPPLLKCV